MSNTACSTAHMLGQICCLQQKGQHATRPGYSCCCNPSPNAIGTSTMVLGADALGAGPGPMSDMSGKCHYPAAGCHDGMQVPAEQLLGPNVCAYCLDTLTVQSRQRKAPGWWQHHSKSATPHWVATPLCRLQAQQLLVG